MSVLRHADLHDLAASFKHCSKIVLNGLWCYAFHKSSALVLPHRWLVAASSLHPSSPSAPHKLDRS